MAGLEPGAMVYFVHSFYCAPEDPSVVAAQTEFTLTYCSAVSIGNIFGVQFHPEKSQKTGLRLISNFLDWKP